MSCERYLPRLNQQIDYNLIIMNSHTYKIILITLLTLTNPPSRSFAESSQTEVTQEPRECVILLHGLFRTKNSMKPMKNWLDKKGFFTVSPGYPSTKKKIEELAAKPIEAGIKTCEDRKVSPIHFVTHSLGGILVRQYLQDNKIEELGHVVMLAPPNKGSELTDQLGDLKLYKWVNGPAGSQLGTSKKSKPKSLGKVNFSLGVIAGSKSNNPLYSKLIPGDDDGKVSVESTKVKGMKDFIALPVNHTFLMGDEGVQEQTLSFLKNGNFKHKEPKPE